MARSWAEIPHVTTFDDVDATRLLEIRSALGTRHEVKSPDGGSGGQGGDARSGGLPRVQRHHRR